MKMMQTVTEPGGTATTAAILGYHVAGKTGTSRMAERGGYSRKYVSFFAGVVPVDNPRFAMAVVVNNPTHGSYYGGLVAGPVFHNVMEGALRLMDVPPDDIDAWLAAQAAAEAKARHGKPAPTFANVTAAPAPVDDEPGNDDARAVMP
jgi:cell division protein FtsI (penicillin-binding protein 3)